MWRAADCPETVALLSPTARKTRPTVRADGHRRPSGGGRLKNAVKDTTQYRPSGKLDPPMETHCPGSV
ncbi:unnamed protein product [Gadus morhua 'NCC']